MTAPSFVLDTGVTSEVNSAQWASVEMLEQLNTLNDAAGFVSRGVDASGNALPVEQLPEFDPNGVCLRFGPANTTYGHRTFNGQRWATAFPDFAVFPKSVVQRTVLLYAQQHLPNTWSAIFGLGGRLILAPPAQSLRSIALPGQFRFQGSSFGGINSIAHSGLVASTSRLSLIHI